MGDVDKVISRQERRPILEAAKTGDKERIMQAIDAADLTIEKIRVLIQLTEGGWQKELQRARTSEVLLGILRTKQRALETSGTPRDPTALEASTPAEAAPAEAKATAQEPARPTVEDRTPATSPAAPVAPAAKGPSRGTRANPSTTPLTSSPEAYRHQQW